MGVQVITRIVVTRNIITRNMVTNEIGNVAVVKCSGRLVSGEGAERLHETVLELLKATAPQIVIDLAEVTFIDSSGLGTLVRLKTGAKSAGGSLRLCQVSPHVERALAISRVCTLVEAYATEEEAITAAVHPQHRGNHRANSAIVCMHESADVRAYLLATLQTAGYDAMSCASLHDARVLAKAIGPRVVIVSAHAISNDPRCAAEFAAINPQIRTVNLPPEFTAQDAGDAAALLLLELAAVQNVYPVL